MKNTIQQIQSNLELYQNFSESSDKKSKKNINQRLELIKNIELLALSIKNELYLNVAKELQLIELDELSTQEIKIDNNFVTNSFKINLN